MAHTHGSGAHTQVLYASLMRTDVTVNLHTRFQAFKVTLISQTFKNLLPLLFNFDKHNNKVIFYGGTKLKMFSQTTA